MPFKNKEDERAWKREYYQRNKDVYSERTRAARRKNVEWVTQYKTDNPCVDCGNTYPPCAMQFDHTGTDKVDSVSTLVKRASRQAVIDEIAKCDLLCANCHAIRTWKRANNAPVV